MGLWLPQGVTVPEETRKPARQKVCGVCVGRNLDRKSGRRARDRRVLLSISGCIVGMSCDCAHVIRLEVLFSMGSRRCCEFAVPSVAHFKEQLGFYAEGPFAHASAHKDENLPSD